MSMVLCLVALRAAQALLLKDGKYIKAEVRKLPVM